MNRDVVLMCDFYTFFFSAQIYVAGSKRYRWVLLQIKGHTSIDYFLAAYSNTRHQLLTSFSLVHARPICNYLRQTFVFCADFTNFPFFPTLLFSFGVLISIIPSDV